MTVKEAVKKYVNDGDLVFLGGFGNCSVYSVVHEIIRQGKKNLKITRCAGGLIFDQLIGTGCLNLPVSYSSGRAYWRKSGFSINLTSDSKGFYVFFFIDDYQTFNH